MSRPPPNAAAVPAPRARRAAAGRGQYACAVLLALLPAAAGHALAGPPQAVAQAAPADGRPAGPVSKAEPRRPERPEDLVRSLYRALDGKAGSFSPADWTDQEIARRLFVPSLADLAIAEGRRAVPDRRLPFDPFTGALQIRPDRIVVQVVSASPTRAEVVVRFTVSHATRTVSYRLAHSADGWRIADIWWGTDKGRTFRRLLR